MNLPQFKNDAELCEFAVELYNSGKLKKEVAEILGINPRKLYDKLKAFGFSIYQKRASDLSLSEEQNVVSWYENGKSLNAIRQEFGYTVHQIRKVFQKYDLKPRDFKFYRELYVNKNAFADLQTEESAYFYGWLLSDGCISNERIILAVHPKDIEILENLKNYVGSSNNIHVGESKVDDRTDKKYLRSSFSFKDDDINARLRSLGMTERKSAKEVCPAAFAFDRHFWRGMLEGDGCISKSSNEISLVGSKEIVHSFGEYVNFLFPEATPKFYTKGKLHVVSLCSKVYSKLVLDELYRDSNYKLSRKYNIYLEKYYGTYTS